MVQPRMVPSGLRDNLDESFRLALALGAVVVGIRPAIDADAAIALARLGLGQADLGKLGVGIDDARDDAGAGVGLQPEQRVPDDDAGVIIGEVGECRAADHVADGIDAAVGGLELVVHLDAVLGDRRRRRGRG